MSPTPAVTSTRPLLRRAIGYLLATFLFVPSCFACLPLSSDAPDRWVIAMSFAIIIGAVSVVLWSLNGRVGLRVFAVTLFAALLGPALAHVSLSELPIIQHRRYCQGDQATARMLVKKMATVLKSEDGQCPSSALAERMDSPVRNFRFIVGETASDKCALIAEGLGAQTGCLYSASLSSGKLAEDLDGWDACRDLCW